MQITIQEVNIENVRNGKNSYDKATVNYLAGGQVREQKVMSFSNPAVFAVLKTVKPGTTVDVEITKNDKGYNQWSQIKVVDTSAEPAVGKQPVTTTARAAGGWETPEERAKKQVLIVKQSALAQATNLVVGSPAYTDKDVNSVIEVAQQLVDWVFDNGFDDKPQKDWPTEDVPF